MSEKDKVAEVIAKRDAFANGVTYAAGMGHLTETYLNRYNIAAEIYPMPKVSVPKILHVSDAVGNTEYRVVDITDYLSVKRVVQYRNSRTRDWRDAPRMTVENITALAQMIVEPNKEVPIDSQEANDACK